MPHFLPVGVAAGLATALLFASASAGGVAGRFLLFFLAPLPSYLAGLGWNSAAAAVAAVVGAVMTAMLLGAQTGVVFFLSQGVPLVVLCHLVMLNRPVQLATSSQPGIEWYPIGRMMAVGALMAGGLASLSMLLLGTDIEQIKTLTRELVDKVLVPQLPGLGGSELGEPEKDALATLLLHALPAGSAVFWLGGFLGNLWLAAKILTVSGRFTRTWPVLTEIQFPQRFGLGLAVALALSFLPGMPGLLATGFAGAFLFAYVLLGLAIIHHGTRGLAARPFILWAVHFGLLVFNTWAALVVAMIAILEPLMWYRRQFGSNPPSRAPPGPSRPPD